MAKLAASLTRGGTTGVFAVEWMGGVGKSALAAETVAQLAEDQNAFPGGAAWISCEGLAGAEGLAEVWSRVARALGLDAVAAQADPDACRAALMRALATRKRTLLALDNVEPGLDADALLDTLAVTGHTALLLTAREAVAPERLQSLILAPLPDPDAAKLFAQMLHRAAEQKGDERPTADDTAAITALVEAEGGLPLAIELTAAYAGVQRLPLGAVLAELGADGLNAAFHMNPRKAPMTRFDRSWRALTPTQQRLFAGLSLLAGASFPRSAALAIATAAHEAPSLVVPASVAAPSNADVRDDLAALVAYALVEPLPGGDRLRLHPLLREYAELQLERLPTDISDRLGDAMVAFWLAYARQYPGYDGMDALEAEAPGLMGAIEWAHDHERHRDVLAFEKAFNFAWRVRGRREEQLKTCIYTEEAAKQLGDISEQRRATHQLSVTLADLGRVAEARAGYAQALALAQQLQDPVRGGSRVTQLGHLSGAATRSGRRGTRTHQ